MVDQTPSGKHPPRRPRPWLPWVLLVVGLIAVSAGVAESLRPGTLLPRSECGAYVLAGALLDTQIVCWALLLGGMGLVLIAGRLARR